MSGTSLDGLDIAYCHFQKKNSAWSFNIITTQNIDYQNDFKEKLKNAITLDPVQLLVFHNEYGNWLGKQVKTFINKNNLEIDFISSHGHTIFHQPKIGITYQIGSGQHIANESNHKVICDFRTNDVALGGQGAPLVPIGDQLLFRNYDFCLNIGGISNISYQINKERIAFDISPANMLLNHICKKINIEYDKGGLIAKQGQIDRDLLNKLNSLEYYKRKHPKSLGYEWFIKKIIPIINDSQNTVENILHTSVYHIAEQIKNTITYSKKENSTMLVTGGGAKNDFLINILKLKLSPSTKLIVPDESLIDYKEALIFAFMGVLKDRNEYNCLQSVTGAKKNSSSGVIYTPS